MVKNLSELEALIRTLGRSYTKYENSILTKVKIADEEIGIVLTLNNETGTLRIAIPLDIEPLEKALAILLHENFISTMYKIGIDYEGYLVVLNDLPSRCINTVKDLKEVLLNTIEGAKSLLKRSRSEE